LTYNPLFSLGRILSYGMAGWLAGLAGSALTDGLQLTLEMALPRMIAALTVIAAGLHLAGWRPKLALVEGLGAPLWRWVEPIGRSLIPPIRSPLQALLYGTVWGWLPCGLVYWGLLIAATVPNPTKGMGFMVAFGAATLPMVSATGMLASWVK
jgi:sulfite exporter TauE/SafE